MGCCLSSTDKPPAPTHHPHFQRSDDSRAPPPVVDEETVKEILSETPKIKLKLLEPIIQDHKTTNQSPQVQVELDPIYKQQQQQQEQKMVLVQEQHEEKWEKRVEISEDVSEICSVQSESVSATTAATRDEEDEVVRQRVVNSRVSPRKLQKSPRDGCGPGRVVGKSPTRRTDSSPGRRYNNGVGRSDQPGQQQPVGGRRVGLRTESTNRRDPGESSGRRSRSPATRVTDNNGGGNRANVGRSPSATRRYPGRAPVENSNSSTRRIAEEPRPEEGKWAANESLDNPLVSLECFIFL